MEAAPTDKQARLAALLAPLRAAPERSAVLTDVDGTIAPIAPRPEDARVLDRARELLRALAGRYALVGCISGRRALDARAMVGLEEISYSGNHGYELLAPGESEPRADPALAGHEADAAKFVAGLDRSGDFERLGIRVEDKGAILALHWRGAANEGEAEAYVNELASAAEWEGLVTHRGRMVLEIRPDVSIDKGRALASLLNGGEIDAALYAGDDRTDLDAFAALAALREGGELTSAVRVAISSEEAPPEVAAGAELVVAGPEGLIEVLEILAS